MTRDIEAEAKALATRFAAIPNRAAFARDFSVPGGQAMIYQHIKALKPIGIAAAQAYMKGFGCTLAEISTYLAAEAAAQGKMAAGGDVPPSRTQSPNQNQTPYVIHNKHTQAVLAMMANATEEQQAQCVGAVAVVLGRKPPSAGNLKQRTGT